MKPRNLRRRLSIGVLCVAYVIGAPLALIGLPILCAALFIDKVFEWIER